MIRIQKLRCAACDHTWDHVFNFPRKFSQFVAELKQLASDGCPTCGVKNRVLLATSTKASKS